MSSIRFSCPTCDREFEVPAIQAGRRGACTHCRARFTIPDAAVASPAPRERVGMPASRLPPLPVQMLADSQVPSNDGANRVERATSRGKLIGLVIVAGLFAVLSMFCVLFTVHEEFEEAVVVDSAPTSPAVESSRFKVDWVSGNREVWSLSRTYGGRVHLRAFRPSSTDRPSQTVLVLGSDDEALQKLAERGFLAIAPMEPESSQELPQWSRELARRERGFDGLHLVGMHWYCREAWELARDQTIPVRSLRLVEPQSALPGPDALTGVTDIPVHLQVTPEHALRALPVGRRIGRMVIAAVVVRPQGSQDWIDALPRE